MDVDVASNVFLVSMVFLLISIILNIYHKNWGAFILNLIIVAAILFAIFKYLDWVTLQMYQGS
jgi:hypothetical protein